MANWGTLIFGSADFTVSPLTWGSAVYEGSEWSSSKTITVTESSGNALTDYPVYFTVPFQSGMKADFSDLRFTLLSDVPEVGVLDYWIETKTDSVSAKVWVKFPTLASSTTTQYKLWYGNAAASSASNRETTLQPVVNANTRVSCRIKEGSGTTLTDDKNAYNGTANLSYAFWETDSNYGIGMRFSTTASQGASFPVNTINDMSAGTIEYWMKQLTNPSPTDSNSYFMKQHNSFNSYGWSNTGANNYVFFQVRNGQNPGWSPTELVDNQWVHLAYTWDASNITVYKNGVVWKTVASGGNIPLDNAPTGTRLGSGVGDAHAGAKTRCVFNGLYISNVAKTSFPYALAASSPPTVVIS